MQTYTHTYIHIHTCIHTYSHTYIHTRRYTHICVRVRVASSCGVVEVTCTSDGGVRDMTVTFRGQAHAVYAYMRPDTCQAVEEEPAIYVIANAMSRDCDVQVRVTRLNKDSNI